MTPLESNVLVLADQVNRQSSLIQILMERLIETEALTEAMLKVWIETACATGPEQHALADRVESYVATGKARLTQRTHQDLAEATQRQKDRSGRG
ncbi:MAG: hypothetical protein AB9869_01225 [Verrucomicrobiia bacterium]